MDIKHYKIKFGFNEADYCEITQEELPKAYGMFLLQEGNGIFSDGTAIRAKDMIRIEPNWHKLMGWTRGWKMTPEDYYIIKPFEKSYHQIQDEARRIAEFAIKTNQFKILALPMSEIQSVLKIEDKRQPEIKKITDSLKNNFKI